MSQYLRVVNWETYQHYKDRNPAWIKLHAVLLDDYDYCSLPDQAKAHLVGIWILASKMNNKIPAEPVFVANRIGATGPVDLEGLVAAGFLAPWDQSLARGRTEDWASRYVCAEVRAEVLSRTNGRCAECGSNEFVEIDHIVPVSRGGSGEPSNLQPLCRKCNRRKRNRLSFKSAERVATQSQGSAEPRDRDRDRDRDRGETEPPKPPKRRRSRVGAETPTKDTPANRAVIDTYNATFGTSIGYTPGNLSATARALEFGYSLAQIQRVFEAVRDSETESAKWCHDNNREFEYLIRPEHVNSRTRMITPGRIDVILNELATGRKAG